MDPIADKLLIASVIIVLIETRVITDIHVIPAIIILLREIAISGLREFLARGQIKLPVTNLAKLKKLKFNVCPLSFPIGMGYDFNNTIWSNIIILSSFSIFYSLFRL